MSCIDVTYKSSVFLVAFCLPIFDALSILHAINNGHCDTVGFDELDMDCPAEEDCTDDKLAAEEDVDGDSLKTGLFSNSWTPSQKA